MSERQDVIQNSRVRSLNSNIKPNQTTANLYNVNKTLTFSVKTANYIKRRTLCCTDITLHSSSNSDFFVIKNNMQPIASNIKAEEINRLNRFLTIILYYFILFWNGKCIENLPYYSPIQTT